MLFDNVFLAHGRPGSLSSELLTVSVTNDVVVWLYFGGPGRRGKRRGTGINKSNNLI
jgi:hypothetical protein